MQQRPSRFVQIVLVCLVLLGVMVYIRHTQTRRYIESQPRTVAMRGDLADIEQTTVSLFKAAAPSVVYIFTENATTGFFGVRQIRQGAGSGFLWDKKGHVVTNFHVIAGARRIQVRLDSGEAIDAAYVGGTPDYDLAVVRLRSKIEDIHPIPLGTSGDLQVGQSVFAIGNPFGLSRTLTTGIISALDRRLPTKQGGEVAGVIQTDAAINPGNSGGPLLDSAGRLIGVNTAIISESGSSAGIGFAVPVDVVNEVVPQLISKGKVSRPGLGVILLNDEAAAAIGAKGVVIERVMEGSAAEKAGLQGIDYNRRTIGDVILVVEEIPVKAVDELLRIFRNYHIGDTIKLQVERRGRVRRVEVELMDVS